MLELGEPFGSSRGQELSLYKLKTGAWGEHTRPHQELFLYIRRMNPIHSPFTTSSITVVFFLLCQQEA